MRAATARSVTAESPSASARSHAAWAISAARCCADLRSAFLRGALDIATSSWLSSLILIDRLINNTPTPHPCKGVLMRNDAMDLSTGPSTAEPAADRAGHIETHGADFIPPSERHGRPRELFWVWMSANVIYLYFVIGGVLMLLGLSLWEALAITIVGNLWWAAVGWLAISGPASG